MPAPLSRSSRAESAMWMTTIIAHTLFRLAAALAIVLAAGAACAGMAYAQQPDDSYPALMDLSIVSEYGDSGGFNRWIIEVKNNNVAGPVARHVRVRIVFTDGNGDEKASIWNIYSLPPGESAEHEFFRPRFTATNLGPSHAALRLEARIIESDPAEPPGFQFNNTTEHWAFVGRRTGVQKFNNGDTGVGVSVSDRFPPAGGATTFTVHAANFSGPDYGTIHVNDHTQIDVQVEISLSKGLAFDETQPQAPSGTTFVTSTGIWDVGGLEELLDDIENIRSLPVAVDLSADDLATLPLEERCLTAKVVSAMPWPLRRENDTATVCLGGEPTVRLASGVIDLIQFYPCIGVTSYPCTSADTLELVAEVQRSETALPGLGRVDEFDEDNAADKTWLQPESVLIHVHDPGGRGTRGGSVIWSTDDILEFTSKQSELTSSWSIAEAVTVTAPDGGNAPGRLVIRSGGYDSFDAPNSAKVGYGAYSLGDIGNDPSEYKYDFEIQFWELGTYEVLWEITGILSGTTYTDSGTYTFHVGPISELEVRDGGASPVAPAGQRAFTIVAVNNGPDDPSAAQVTLTGLNAADCDADSAQATKGAVAWDSVNSNCVWTIGELISKDIAPAARRRDRETLTIITSAAVDSEITAAITSTQAYQVCIDSSGEDVELASPSSTACTDEDATNTWHTTPYYDHISGNDSATIKAKEATGTDLPA